MKKGITYYPVKQLSSEWHLLRCNRITASVAAACLGVSSYHSPQKACRMIWGTEEHVSNYYMEHGREHEADCVCCYEDVTGNLTRETGFWVNDATPWLGASPDRTVLGGGLLEAKCSNKSYDTVPLGWIVQAYVQMWCCLEPWCDVAHWQDGCISIARVYPEKLQEIVGSLEQFYNIYVRESHEPRRGEIKPCPILTALAPMPFVRYAC